MSQRTKIQWCDSAVNPTKGCDGCELWNVDEQRCYAGNITRRFGKSNPGLATVFELVERAPGRMAQAAKWRDLTGTQRPSKPWLNGLARIIFVSDMSDALSRAISFEYLRDEIITNVSGNAGCRHRWLWLTKRPARLAKFSRWLGKENIAWPPNLWVGTSITTRQSRERISHLLRVGDEETIRFLSVEPQWEPIDLDERCSELDWIIQGGESGPRAKAFDIAWATRLIRQCRELGVPYFLKQLGSRVVHRGRPVMFKEYQGGDWAEWPADLRVRQMPITWQDGRQLQTRDAGSGVRHRADELEG